MGTYSPGKALVVYEINRQVWAVSCLTCIEVDGLSRQQGTGMIRTFPTAPSPTTTPVYWVQGYSIVRKASEHVVEVVIVRYQVERHVQHVLDYTRSTLDSHLILRVAAISPRTEIVYHSLR